MRMSVSLLFWLTFLSSVAWFFSTLLEDANNPNKVVLIQEAKDQSSEVVLKRNRQGHYVATGEINGQEVVFLLDTGATHISIPMSVAKRLKLRKGFDSEVSTANGTITVHSTKISSIKLGNIQSKRVVAHVNPHMKGEEVLLGMTFLKLLEITQLGDELTLRIPSSSEQ
ncbi:MAG: aspartyl protease family protein [Saprospiraceae bacterium]|jgi:aspartyl protease family protein